MSLLIQKNTETHSNNETIELLKPVAYFFVVLYSFLTLAHLFLLEDSFKWIMLFVALTTATVSLVIGLTSSRISLMHHSRFILLLLFMASSNSLLHLWFSHAPEHTTNIFVTIIASGIVLSNRSHWIASIVFNWIGWSFINFALEMALFQHFFFAMAMSTLLSWFAHLARKKLVEKQMELLQERDLAIQHEQEAKAATLAKSEFLAVMSHEIRTPMNGVIGMIDLVSRSKLDEQQQGFIASAKRSADSLLIIINDVLDFSKIEAGELAIELVTFDLERFFAELIADQQFLANKKGLKLALTNHSYPQRKVVGDPHRITQILNNLLSNAIKFTESGHIKVHYELVTVDDHLQLSVEISDTGIGISEQSLPFLFDSFSQADMSTTRNFGGTGLGLAISKQLCELMGGSISAQSKVGEGSTFHFTIQLQEAVPTSISEKTPQDNQTLSSFDNLQVLVVEDNFINQEVMKAVLDEFDINVELANDGLEALSILAAPESTKFDLIFMDCQMPKMDGYEATRRIRADEVSGHIPIIALTANTMNSEKEKCLEVGMDDYLSKPINTEALYAMLAKYQPS